MFTNLIYNRRNFSPVFWSTENLSLICKVKCKACHVKANSGPLNFLKQPNSFLFGKPELKKLNCTCWL